MKYMCTICNYETMRKSSYNNHCKSNKHNEKVNECNKFTQSTTVKPQLEQFYAKKNETIDVDINDVISVNSDTENKAKKYVCTLCNMDFSRKDSFERHLRSCKIAEINMIRQEYETKTKILEKDVILLNSENKDLRNLVEYFKGILGTTTETLDKSVTAYKLATQKFPKPILLSSPDNYELLIHNEDYPKLEDHNYVDDNDKLIDTLTYEYSKKRLPKYIGDFVVRCYKKEGDEIKTQSLWNSDTTRLNYIIAVEINKENMWNIDKKGTKVKELIIIPTFNKIKPILEDYIKKITVGNKLNNIQNWSDKAREFDKIKYASEIIKEIDEDTLSISVLKYIAPYFYLSKDGTE